MYILYRQTSAENDPRHVFIYQNFNLQLVEVGNPDWVNWELGNPEIFPEHLADQGINFLRPASKGYKNTITGAMTPTKGTETAPENYEKIVRPWTSEEAKKVADFSRIILRRHVEEIYRQRVAALNNTAIEYEMGTWTQQRKEAEAGGGPLLDAISSGRRVAVEVIISKVLAKAAAYDEEVGRLIGEKQYYTDKLEAATTIRDLAVLAEDWFGIPRHSEFGDAVKRDFAIHI